ncbi:hypothetical protein FMUND_11795 [Fusarium mundagurra]|uniref:Uncharacterized protein n=1 Tax=Fusarium mundagurra TaxID=1567541 RepID=A0A8H6D6S2_9HYPO|nr:hypothetical protein FMUND_11795 [Fusarium mundagurra]
MSSSSNNTNNQRQASLPNIPTEIFFDIIHKYGLEWKDYYSLRRTSSRLSHLACEPTYQGGDYCIFRMACFHGDLDTLAICAQCNAVPTQCSPKALFEGPLGLIKPGHGVHPNETEDDNYKETDYFNAWGDGRYGPSDIVILGFYEGNFSAERFIETNCPPSIVELYLRQVNDEGLVFNYSRTWLSSWRGLGSISEFLRILFDDMFAPWIFKGDSTRSMSDDLQEKICLLTQHQGANAFELYVLQDIVTALRKIDARKVSQGNLDFGRDGVWCWYTLCMAVAYISDEDVQKQTVDLHFTDPGDWEMINPYFSRSWSPHEELANARRKVLEERALESGQDLNDIEPQGEVSVGRKWTQMPLDAWDFIL